MMINSVPSLSVSLDILLSEVSVRGESPILMSTQPNSPRDPRAPAQSTSRHTRRSSMPSRTESSLSARIEDLIGRKEVTGQLVSDLRKNAALDNIPLHPRRWLALALFCSIYFMQTVIWNTWSPIAAAALYAFPSWTAGSVAIFSNWGPLCTVIFMLPINWMLHEKGLRFGCIVGSSLCTIGSAIRCLTTDELWFTLFAHMGAIMNALAGVIFGPCIVLLSSLWFPADQRASATGAGTAVSALGIACSYLFGPLLISLPIPDYHIQSVQDKLREEIQKLMYFDFIINFTLLMFLLWLFPATPPGPASTSSSVSLIYKRNFKKSVKQLLSDGNVWLLGVSAALSAGMTGPWLSQLTILFTQRGVTPIESASLGFWTIISSCFFSVTATRFSDIFQGHIKIILIGLLGFGTSMFIWLYKIVKTATIEKHRLIIAVISGFSATWSSSPLYYELGAEIAYPVPEGILAGYIMFMSSFSSVFVYGFFYCFSDTKLLLLVLGLISYMVFSVILIILVQEQYNRLVIDKNS